MLPAAIINPEPWVTRSVEGAWRRQRRGLRRKGRHMGGRPGTAPKRQRRQHQAGGESGFPLICHGRLLSSGASRRGSPQPSGGAAWPVPQNYRIQPGISNDFRPFRRGRETVKGAVIGSATWDCERRWGSGTGREAASAAQALQRSRFMEIGRFQKITSAWRTSTRRRHRISPVPPPRTPPRASTCRRESFSFSPRSSWDPSGIAGCPRPSRTGRL